MSAPRALTSDLFKVGCAVLIVTVLLRVIGVWRWTVTTPVSRWPWLLERYEIAFPIVLIFTLLFIQRLSIVRDNWALAMILGALAGIISSVLTLAAVQLFGSPQRDNFLHGFQLEGGGVGFVVLGLAMAIVCLLGWLYGILASLLVHLFVRVGQS